MLKAIQMEISLIENMSEIIDEINKKSVIANLTIRLDKQLIDKRKELDKIICVTDNLYMDWRSGDITRTEYVRMKTKFEAKAEEIKQNISYLETEIDLSSKGIGNDDPYLKMFLKHNNIEELNRGILVELIDTIHIHENKEITINFKFADQYKRVSEFITNNHVGEE